MNVYCGWCCCSTLLRHIPKSPATVVSSSEMENDFKEYVERKKKRFPAKNLTWSSISRRLAWCGLKPSRVSLVSSTCKQKQMLRWKQVHPIRSRSLIRTIAFKLRFKLKRLLTFCRQLLTVAMTFAVFSRTSLLAAPRAAKRVDFRSAFTWKAKANRIETKCVYVFIRYVGYVL